MTFFTLLINDSKYLVGFIRVAWDDLFQKGEIENRLRNETFCRTGRPEAGLVSEFRFWFLKDVLDGLARNEECYGFFLCPCRDSWGIREKDSYVKCPYRYAKADIEEFSR